jgi:hypothetical protein
MPVFTVMAENADGDAPKLHNEAVRLAAHALTTVERFRKHGLQRIRIYRETQEIDESELRAAATEETGSHSTR